MRSVQISPTESRVVDALAASALSIALQNLPPAIKAPEPLVATSSEAASILAVACYLRK